MTSFVARHTLTSRKKQVQGLQYLIKINTLSRKNRRQPMLCMSSRPSENMTTAMGCQALISSPVAWGHHTFANASGFRDRGPTLTLLTQLSCDFGRIAIKIKP